MATAAELLADAQAALTGESGDDNAALKLFRQAAMLAVSTRDWDTAENAARAAMACLTTMPDSGQGGRGVQANLTWSAAQIDALLNQIRKARRDDGDSGLRTIKTKYVTSAHDNEW